MKENLVNLVEKVFTNTIYKQIYKTPERPDDIILESDGKYL